MVHQGMVGVPKEVEVVFEFCFEEFYLLVCVLVLVLAQAGASFFQLVGWFRSTAISTLLYYPLLNYSTLYRFHI